MISPILAFYNLDFAIVRYSLSLESMLVDQR